MSAIERAAVVGLGEVGRRLAAALTAAKIEVRPVGRESGWSGLEDPAVGPVLVCVREEALEEVLTRLAGIASSRLAFVQNGWIRPLLGALPEATRGLIWFTSKGEFFRALRPSLFGGPLAETLAEALGGGGLAAAPLDDATFRAAEAEKMGFNCVVGLPLAVHGLTLGDYLARHAEEAEALFHESVTVCARSLGVAADPGWWAAFRRVVEPLAWVKASAAKALEYRSGAVARLARELDIEVPVTARLLAAAGAAA
jgi:ketopantoate reductase